MNKIFKLASAFKMKCSSPMKQVTGPGKKKPTTPAPTFDPAQRIGGGEGNIGGPGASTAVYNFNRPRPVADNELMQKKDVSYNQSKKYAKAVNAGVENEVRWNVERQAKMDSTNTANEAKFKGLNLAQQKKAGSDAANATRTAIGSKSHPKVRRIPGGDGYDEFSTPAHKNDKYYRTGSFEVKYDYKDLQD